MIKREKQRVMRMSSVREHACAFAHHIVACAKVKKRCRSPKRKHNNNNRKQGGVSTYRH